MECGGDFATQGGGAAGGRERWRWFCFLIRPGNLWHDVRMTPRKPLVAFLVMVAIGTIGCGPPSIEDEIDQDGCGVEREGTDDKLSGLFDWSQPESSLVEVIVRIEGGALSGPLPNDMAERQQVLDRLHRETEELQRCALVELKRRGGVLNNQLLTLNMFFAALPLGAVKPLASRKDVVYVEMNQVLPLAD